MKETIVCSAVSAYEAPCCMALDLAPEQVICLSNPNGIDGASENEMGNY